MPVFLAIMWELLALAPNAALRPDPAFVDEYRTALGDAIERPARIDYGDPLHPDE